MLSGLTKWMPGAPDNQHGHRIARVLGLHPYDRKSHNKKNQIALH